MPYTAFVLLSALLLWAPLPALCGIAVRPLVALLTGLGVVGCAAAVVFALGSEVRTLVVQVGAPVFVDGGVARALFDVETRSSAAFVWPLVGAGWALAWAFVLWRARTPVHPWRTGLAYGLLAPGLLLAMQLAAAPSPFALGPSPLYVPTMEVALLPAAMTAGVLLAQRLGRVGPMFFQLVLWLAVVRVPWATATHAATQGRRGTTLDVSSIVSYADVFVGRPVETTPGSDEQIRTLILIPQTILLPAMSFVVAFGVGVLAVMLRRHRETRGTMRR